MTKLSELSKTQARKTVTNSISSAWDGKRADPEDIPLVIHILITPTNANYANSAEVLAAVFQILALHFMSSCTNNFRLSIKFNTTWGITDIFMRITLYIYPDPDVKLKDFLDIMPYMLAVISATVELLKGSPLWPTEQWKVYNVPGRLGIIELYPDLKGVHDHD